MRYGSFGVLGAVVAGVALALFVPAASATAEVCVICYGDEACGPSSLPNGPCCCTITHIGGGNLMCTQWCYSCTGYGQPPNCYAACGSCSASSRVEGPRVASLFSPPRDPWLGSEFLFTRGAFEKLSQGAPLIAMLLKNLSAGCKSKAEYTGPLTAARAPFEGRVTIVTPFRYKGPYSGTLTTRGGLAEIEVVLGKGTEVAGARRIRAIVEPSGSLRSYEDSGSNSR